MTVEVRAALEPLAQLAHRTGALVKVHLGKSDRADVVTAVLGSRAFTAVSRAVLVAARDPDAEDGACVLSVEKANLGRLDVPGLRYKIESASVPTPEGPADVGRLVLLGESDCQVRDFYADHADTDERSDRALLVAVPVLDRLHRLRNRVLCTAALDVTDDDLEYGQAAWLTRAAGGPPSLTSSEPKDVAAARRRIAEPINPSSDIEETA